MEIPTARILDDGSIRLGVAQAMPFRWYSVGMGIFPGLEFVGGFTVVEDRPAFAGFSSHIDESFALKYQILPESRWLPALAVGIQDFFGTRTYASEYVALSRQIFPFDFTLGFGRKRLKGLSLPYIDEVGVFGGIEFAVSPRFSLMAEYNPIHYEKDRRLGVLQLPPVVEGAKYPVDLGLRFKLLPNILLGFSVQRGDTLGLSLHFQDSLGEPVLPHRADPPPRLPLPSEAKPDIDHKEMASKIHEEIQKAGFADVAVYTDGQELTAEFSNSQYLSNQKATGRVLRILLLHASSDTKKLTAVIKRKGINLLSVSVEPGHLQKYLLGEIRQETFEKLVEVKNPGSTAPPPESHVYADDDSISYSYGIKPDFQPFLKDAGGYVKFRTGIKPFIVFNLWKGAQVSARYDIPLYSNIEARALTPEDSVRSDSWRYLGKDYTFDRLMLDQTIPLGSRTFGRISFGYLEYMYAGVGGELLHILGDGRFALGLESDWVRKREAGTQFGLMDVERHTLLANGYYSIPALGMTFHAQYGRFMAEDVGWRLIVSREFDTGIIIGGWYSQTDTNHLKGLNRGYNDKGIFISIPVRILLTHDSPRRYSYATSPWSREPGATPEHWQTLHGFAGDLTPSKFLSDIQELKE